VISSRDAGKFKSKSSKEKTMKGTNLYSPVDLDKKFDKEFQKKNWKESRYFYYITLDRGVIGKNLNDVGK